MIVLENPDPRKIQAITLRRALGLEALGMRRRGQSALSIAKRDFGLKGSRDKVLIGLEMWIRENIGEHMADRRIAP